MEMITLLKVNQLKKAFGGVMAVAGVSFEVKKNQIKSIIGPNGAGKTTIFNLISGVYPPLEGEIHFQGQNLIHLPPHQICSMGISRTFQNVILFKRMTVLENVMVGRHSKVNTHFISTIFRLPTFKKEEKAIIEKAMELMVLVGLERKAFEMAQNLPLGEQKLLEIARALATDPQMILLDEPAGGLNMAELEAIIRLIRKIKEKGIAILLVEHNMRVVMDVSDEIMVLNFGEQIASGPPKEIKGNEKVIQAYLGKGVRFARSM
jgi:branched-chain amino acid transport system ATP-binding protein